MTRGAWMCRQQDDGLKIWCAPRENEKPFTDSERAQKWRLSLASLLFLTILLSDHLWFCAEAKLTRTRDKRLEKLAPTDMNDYQTANHILSPSPHPPRSSLNKKDIFIGNSTERLRRLETCHPDSLSKDCFTFDNPETVCKGLSGMAGRQSEELNLSDLYLSFCNSYSLLDLFYGFSSPENLSCSLDMVVDGNHRDCSQCVRAYQRYDQYAQERYEEFEIMVQKYETDAYSVRTCMEECKTVYKPWLCSQLFHLTQMHCTNKIPCKQYCLEVQQRCPFILPDESDLIQGGSPSFICAGLSGNQAGIVETECCDVRWDLKRDGRFRGTEERTHAACLHRTSVSTSAASRLCNSRLKLCVLVLILLHTAVILSTTHNSTALGLGPLCPMEESSANEE